MACHTHESELLLQCSRVSLDDAAKDKLVALCEKDLDWNMVLNAAEMHGLTPLLYWHLRSTNSKSIPDDRMQALSELFMSHTGRNLTLANELVSILEAFDRRRITGVPLKGIVLAENYYGDASLRASGDLDILIDRESVSTACNILRDRGYVPCPWYHKRLDEQIFSSEQFSKLCFEYTFVREDEQIYVDLHWELIDTEFLKMSAVKVMQRLQTCDFHGKRISVLDAESCLIFLCAHASKHGWYRLGWIVDIAELLEQMTNVNWDAFFNLARAGGAERMVLVGAYLTTFLPRQKLNSALDRRINADPTVKQMGDEIINRFLGDSNAPEWKELKKWFFFLALKQSWSEKVRLVWRLASQPTLDEWIRCPLPDRRFFFYFLLRPVNLFTDHVMRVGRRLVTGGYDRNLNRKPGR